MVAQLNSKQKPKRKEYKWRSDTRLTKEQQQQVLDHLGLVCMLAYRLSSKMSKSKTHQELMFEDFYAVGVEALCYAVDRFNPNAGYKFSPYASTVILSDLNKNIAKDISKGIKVPAKYCLRPNQLLGSILSLDQRVPGDDNEMCLSDAIACPAARILEEQNNVRLLIEECLAQLNSQEERVFQLYYLEEKTLGEVGEEIGLNKRQVQTILERGKLKIRNWFTLA